MPPAGTAGVPSFLFCPGPPGGGAPLPCVRVRLSCPSTQPKAHPRPAGSSGFNNHVWRLYLVRQGGQKPIHAQRALPGTIIMYSYYTTTPFVRSPPNRAYSVWCIFIRSKLNIFHTFVNPFPAKIKPAVFFPIFMQFV